MPAPSCKSWFDGVHRARWCPRFRSSWFEGAHQYGSFFHVTFVPRHLITSQTESFRCLAEELMVHNPRGGLSQLKRQFTEGCRVVISGHGAGILSTWVRVQADSSSCLSLSILPLLSQPYSDCIVQIGVSCDCLVRSNLTQIHILNQLLGQFFCWRYSKKSCL